MLDITTSKLGTVSAITISTSDLDASLEFYQKLGFKELYRGDVPFQWIHISDDTLLIMLRKDSTPYIALTYYGSELDEVTAGLEEQGITFVIKPDSGDMIKRWLMKSPDGINISLVSAMGFQQPAGQNLLTMPQEDFFNPAKYPNKACGIFGEFAHPVKDIDQSMIFWEKLGFKILSKMESPYDWAIISDGLSIVGLHQTNGFVNPTITFFAADMKEKIEKLKALGLKEFVDKGVSNTTLTTPEKQRINLFKLGM